MKVMKKNVLTAAGTLFLTFISSYAMAQGFASEASTLIENIRDGIVIVIGIIATVALVWQLAEGFMGRKTWADVFTTCLWIFGAGAAVAGATWIFTSGQSVSF